jgi:hypothetical protein
MKREAPPNDLADAEVTDQAANPEGCWLSASPCDTQKLSLNASRFSQLFLP